MGLWTFTGYDRGLGVDGEMWPMFGPFIDRNLIEQLFTMGKLDKRNGNGKSVLDSFFENVDDPEDDDEFLYGLELSAEDAYCVVCLFEQNLCEYLFEKRGTAEEYQLQMAERLFEYLWMRADKGAPTMLEEG